MLLHMEPFVVAYNNQLHLITSESQITQILVCIFIKDINKSDKILGTSKCWV